MVWGGLRKPIVKRSKRRPLFVEVLEDRIVPTITAMPDSYSVFHDHVLNNSSNVLISNDMLMMNPGPLTASKVSDPGHGSVTVNSDGTFQYTPTSGYTGSDSFIYRAAANGESSDATVTISVTNTAPLVTNGSFSVIHDSLLLNSNLLATASDNEGDAMTVTIVTGPSHGQLAQASGSLYDYTPNAGWTGTESVTITVSDGIATSTSAIISISVTNSVPSVSNASFSVERNLLLPGIDLNQYLSDAQGDPLVISIVSGPSHGQLTQNDDGTYIYTAASSYVGTDTITFKGNDGVADSNNGTITITCTQYAPTSNNTYSYLHDRTLPNIDFSANDMDAMGNPAWIEIASGPSHGSLSHNSDGTWDYAPAAHYYGADSVTIRAAIPNMYGPWQDVTVTINVTDNAPVAIQTHVSIEAYDQIAEDLNLLAAATDADADSLTIDMVTSPSHGSLDLNSTTGFYDYHANSSYEGLDNFSFRLYDGARYSQTINASILSYDDSVDRLGSLIQGFEAIANARVVGNGGVANALSVRQGQIENCWFVAAAASLADRRPATITDDDFLKEENNGTYTVTFPGKTAINIDMALYTAAGVVPAGRSWSSTNGNGDWLPVLQMAAGQYWAGATATPAAAFAKMDAGSFAGPAIRLLSGNNKWNTTSGVFTWASTLATNIQTALNNHMIITAYVRAPDPDTTGIAALHEYTILGYDAINGVHLSNPHGSNRNYTETRTVAATASQPASTITRTTNRNLDGGPDFWMIMSEFRSLFNSIEYEK
ncbi:MAG: tandem-95 repeat protein [Gemmataceae bacterium]|nr:tandem-95 repeat protein [Gemmataceae bacterium]